MLSVVVCMWKFSAHNVCTTTQEIMPVHVINHNVHVYYLHVSYLLECTSNSSHPRIVAARGAQ